VGQVDLSGSLVIGPTGGGDGAFPTSQDHVSLATTPSPKPSQVASGTISRTLNSPSAYVELSGVGTDDTVTRGDFLYFRADGPVMLRLTFNDPAGGEDLVLDGTGRPLNPRFLDDALLTAMERAGFTGIGITPESASDEVLRGLNKGFTTEDVRRAAETVARHKLPCCWIFMLGGPGETRETVRETFDFAARYVRKNDVAFFNAARPHQGIDQKIPEKMEFSGEGKCEGKIIAFPVLNGLHHDYRRAA
jgi:hypothetical protein